MSIWKKLTKGIDPEDPESGYDSGYVAGVKTALAEASKFARESHLCFDSTGQVRLGDVDYIATFIALDAPDEEG